MNIASDIFKVALILLIILLGGCGKKCIKSHEEKGTCMITRHGKENIIVVPVECNHIVCDEYE